MKNKYGAVYTNGHTMFLITQSQSGFFVEIEEEETMMYLGEQSMSNWIINNKLELIGYL